MWLLWPSWLCFLLSLALSDQHEPEVPGGPGVLRCGLQSFWFVVDLANPEAAPVLTVWDKQGSPHRLQNDSSCGTWVKVGPGSSVVLEATYDGCYVTEWGSHYVMPVGVEGTEAAPHTRLTRTRLLACPVERAGDCELLGCCYSSQEEEAGSCYYGNTVTSRCTQEGHFSIAVSRNSTWPPLHLDSVHLASGNDSDCDPVAATRVFLLFRFPFTSCGTTRRTAGDQVVYENELVATRDVRTWGHGAITRDSIFRLRVSCSYSTNSDTFPVNAQVLTLPPPLAEARPGALALELQIAKDENYSSYYTAEDYPVVKLLRDPVYVEVSVLHRTDPNLGLLLPQCWATPSPDPLRLPQWPILVKGCPYAGDNYQTRLTPVQEAPSLPFPSHRQRFSVSTFSFVDSARPEEALRGQVYLHCSASMCQPAGTPSCVVACPVVSGRRSDSSLQNSTASISSNGPVILLQASKDPLEKSHTYLGAPVDPKALWVAGLSGILIVGALLVFYLAIRRWR